MFGLMQEYAPDGEPLALNKDLRKSQDWSFMESVG